LGGPSEKDGGAAFGDSGVYCSEEENAGANLGGPREKDGGAAFGDSGVYCSEEENAGANLGDSGW
jgi:hypothetical protein